MPRVLACRFSTASHLDRGDIASRPARALKGARGDGWCGPADDDAGADRPARPFGIDALPPKVGDLTRFRLVSCPVVRRSASPSHLSRSPYVERRLHELQAGRCGLRSASPSIATGLPAVLAKSRDIAAVVDVVAPGADVLAVRRPARAHRLAARPDPLVTIPGASRRG